ncbi:MAG: flagellar biosynthesis protein FlgC [Pseudomonadota bacterium]|nr:flagellar biosynthesis protein FlgC [Pseudomonadota bacterium]
MSIDSIFAATRFGLEFERLRLEAASHNIAIANTPVAPGHSAQMLRAAAPSGAGFDAAIGVGTQPALVATDADERQVHDPSDPAADGNGMVSYPRIDLVGEMSTLMQAGRAYEANVRAFNTLRSMTLHSLDIGNGT